MNKLLLGIAAIVLSTNVNAKGGMHCAENEAPFLGINTNKDKCCIVFNDADDEKTVLHGSADTSYALNKNFVIATCKIDIPEEVADDIAPVHGRIKVEGCNIGVKGKGKAEDGIGGFTIDLEERVINGNCKADNNYGI